jgi:hypothetical protein
MANEQPNPQSLLTNFIPMQRNNHTSSAHTRHRYQEGVGSPITDTGARAHVTSLPRARRAPRHPTCTQSKPSISAPSGLLNPGGPLPSTEKHTQSQCPSFLMQLHHDAVSSSIADTTHFGILLKCCISLAPPTSGISGRPEYLIPARGPSEPTRWHRKSAGTEWDSAPSITSIQPISADSADRVSS